MKKGMILTSHDIRIDSLNSFYRYVNFISIFCVLVGHVVAVFGVLELALGSLVLFVARD